MIKACRDLRIVHGRSTPHRHQSNAFCESTVRKCIEGARALLEHAGMPSCFWVHAVRHWCLMDNTAFRDGDTAWNKRHGKGHFPGPRLPFGCLVDFLPRPDSVKAMPKFEPRAVPGIFVGYRLQPGATWNREYLVFPKSYFEGYDFDRPHNLVELTPVITQECRQIGELSFPLKSLYDSHRRCFKPVCIIRTIDEIAAQDPEDDGDDEGEDTPSTDGVPARTEPRNPADAPSGGRRRRGRLGQRFVR